MRCSERRLSDAAVGDQLGGGLGNADRDRRLAGDRQRKLDRPGERLTRVHDLVHEPELRGARGVDPSLARSSASPSGSHCV